MLASTYTQLSVYSSVLYYCIQMRAACKPKNNIIIIIIIIKFIPT